VEEKGDFDPGGKVALVFFIPACWCTPCFALLAPPACTAAPTWLPATVPELVLVFLVNDETKFETVLEKLDAAALTEVPPFLAPAAADDDDDGDDDDKGDEELAEAGETGDWDWIVVLAITPPMAALVEGELAPACVLVLPDLISCMTVEEGMIMAALGETVEALVVVVKLELLAMPSPPLEDWDEIPSLATSA
jgi:hypothetical protein